MWGLGVAPGCGLVVAPGVWVGVAPSLWVGVAPGVWVGRGAGCVGWGFCRMDMSVSSILPLHHLRLLLIE